MTNELKPCAHCSSEDVIVEKGSPPPMRAVQKRVRCNQCGIVSAWRLDGSNAVDDWNRRAPSEAVGLLREVVDDTERVDDGPLDSKIVDNIRRFLAAQDKEST